MAAENQIGLQTSFNAKDFPLFFWFGKPQNWETVNKINLIEEFILKEEF